MSLIIMGEESPNQKRSSKSSDLPRSRGDRTSTMDYFAAKAYILNRLEHELHPNLYYHGKHHTLDVLGVAIRLCEEEQVSPHNTILVKTAALYHDCGFIIGPKDHEEVSCGIAKEVLPGFGYQPADIEKICGMIMATKIPQSPANKLEEILCDADLDYLGRDDFFPIAHTLFKELRSMNILDDEKAWNRTQLRFLESHSYHTPSKQLSRKPKKQKHLHIIRTMVKNYDP